MDVEKIVQFHKKY